MLQKIRSKTAGIVFKILFGLLIASFALWGVADMFRTDDNSIVVGSIDGAKITKGQLNIDLQQQAQMFSQMFGQNFGIERLRAMGFEKSLLQNKLDKLAFSRFADEFKLGVGETQVRDAILKRREFQNQNGQFDASRYQAALANGMSEAMLIQSVKHEIARKATLSALVPSPVSKTLVENKNAFQNEKRTAKYVKFDVRAQTVPAPTPEQVKAYYEANHPKFMAPEYRSFQLLKLSPVDYAEKILLTEDELKAEYEARIADYTRPEKRDAIEYVAADLETAKKVKAALVQGKAGDKLVEEFGSDKVSKREWGMVNADEIPDSIRDSVLALQVNGLSDPLETKEGFHVVHVKKVEHGGVDSFDTVKDSLGKKLKIARATDEIIEKTNLIDDALAEGKTLAEIATSQNVQLIQIPLVDLKGNPKTSATTPSIRDNDILQTAFVTQKDEPSTIQETKKGEYFNVAVTEIVPTTVKPLASVNADVIKFWTAAEQKKTAKKKAVALVADLKKGKPFPQAKTSEAFKRSGDGLKGLFPINLVQSLFKGRKGFSDMGLQGDHYVVAQLDTITNAPSLEAEARAELVKKLETEQKADLEASFVSALKERYDAKIRLINQDPDMAEELEG